MKFDVLQTVALCTGRCERDLGIPCKVGERQSSKQVLIVNGVWSISELHHEFSQILSK